MWQKISGCPVRLKLSLSYFQLCKLRKTDSNANHILSIEMQIVSTGIQLIIAHSSEIIDQYVSFISNCKFILASFI